MSRRPATGDWSKMRIVDVSEVCVGRRFGARHMKLYAEIEARHPKAVVFDATECPDPAKFRDAGRAFFRKKYGNDCFHYRMLPGEIAAWLTKDAGGAT